MVYIVISSGCYDKMSDKEKLREEGFMSQSFQESQSTVAERWHSSHWVTLHPQLSHCIHSETQGHTASTGRHWVTLHPQWSHCIHNETLGHTASTARHWVTLHTQPEAWRRTLVLSSLPPFYSVQYPRSCADVTNI